MERFTGEVAWRKFFWKVGGTGDGGRDEEIPEEGDEREAIRNAVRLTMAGE